jgi:hypothetical protein
MAEAVITFYQFLVLVIGMFLVGWVARISYQQFKAEKQREAEADERREAYIKKQEQKNLWARNLAESEKLFEGGAKK